MRFRFSVFSFFLFVFCNWLTPSYAQQPVVGRAARFGASPPVRSLKPAPPAPPAVDSGTVREIPRPPSPRGDRARGPIDRVDSAVQDSMPQANMPNPTATFEGISSDDNLAEYGFRVLPPDTNGDVGPNHYVQAVNVLFRVFDKTGTPSTAPLRISDLFVGFGGPCESSDDGDPIVLYDHLADRWLISQFALVGLPFHQCIAISQTGDPTGAYFLYDFVMPNNKLNDYPKFGVWPGAYYMTDNQFNAAGTVFQGAGVFAFDRAKMLAGDPNASSIYFDLHGVDPAISGMLPADLDGSAPPPGTPN